MKRKITFLFLCLAAVIYVAGPVLAGPNEDFARANSLYRDGKYEQAIQAYEELIKESGDNGVVFYNLGNSYYKNKQTGKAILYYNRALKLIPRDQDLTANEKFVAAEVPGRVDASPDFISRIFRDHVRFYTLNEMVLILTVLLILMGMVNVFGMYFRWEMSRMVLMVLGFVFLIFAAGLIIKAGEEMKAAVMVRAAPARFEPTNKATVYFELPQGQKVRLLERDKDWSKVIRPDGKVGWVSEENVEKI